MRGGIVVMGAARGVASAWAVWLREAGHSTELNPEGRSPITPGDLVIVDLAALPATSLVPLSTSQRVLAIVAADAVKPAVQALQAGAVGCLAHPVQREELLHAVAEALTATHNTRARLQTILDTVLDGLITINQRGIVQTFNPAAERLFGYRASEVVGHNIRLLMPEPHQSKHDDYLAQYARTGNPHIIGTVRELMAVHKEGHPLPIELSVSEFQEHGRRLFIGTIRDVSERKAAEEDRKRLLQQLITAEEDVRRRIARDLHDGVGQSLLSIMLQLHAVAETLTSEASARVYRVSEATRTLLEEVRQLARGLHPSVLDDLGLAAALKRFAAEMARTQRLQVDVHIDPASETRLPASIEITLYRITQEALANVVKHAGASTVSVLLRHHPGLVQLIVEDDGDGFDVEVVRTGAIKSGKLGLANLRERAALLGGTVTIESRPGQGTTLYIQIPLGQQP